MIQDGQAVKFVNGGDPARIQRVQIANGRDRFRVPRVIPSATGMEVQVVTGFDETRAPYINPLGDLSPAAWFRAGEGQTVTGSGVSQWSDQSGNARHLLQGTDSARPALQADGSVLFNGSAHFLQTNAFTLNQPTCVVMAVKQVSWTSNDFIFDGVGGVNIGACAQLNGGVSPQLVINAGGSSAANSNLAIGAVGVVCAVFNGASGVFRINNTTALTGNYGSSNMGGLTVGKRGDATASNYSNIQTYEVLILPVAPSTAQLDRIVRYMAGKYGVAL